MPEDILVIVLEGIVSEVLKQPGYALQPDEALISSGLIDSFSLVDLTLFVEDRLGVVLDESELSSAKFDTAIELARLIEEKRAAP